MKLCLAHANRLQTALTERGLDNVIVQAGTPDPFQSARFALTMNVLMSAGAFALVPDANDQLPCPLCHMVSLAKAVEDERTPEQRAAVIDTWIDHAADEQRAHFLPTKGAA